MTQKDIFIPSGSLVVLSGLPGAGKSSLKATAKNFRDLDQAWLSMDDLRLQLLGSYVDLDDEGRTFDEVPQSANTEVFDILRTMVNARLFHGRTCILDGTWLTDADRKTWADLAAKHGANFLVLIMDTPVEACVADNSQRSKRVPEFRIREMHEPPKPQPLVTPSGKVVEQTAAQGFMRTSEYPHVVLNRGDRLVHQLPDLGHEQWDIVGDVHGLTQEFVALLQKAGWNVSEGRISHPQGRKLLLLGDIVDRGYDSLGLIRLIRRAVRDGVAECLQGNHEDKVIRFYDQAVREGIDRWTSYANAETGMQLVLAEDGAELVAFLRSLPTFKVLRTQDGRNFAFVHGDMKRFDAELTAASDMVYGQSGYRRGVDSDAQYEERYQKGLNTWTLFRGHIPQTSPQEHIFSLERHPFQKGELVLLRLDDMLQAIRAGASQQEAFSANLVTHSCDYDFEAVSRKWDLMKGVEALVTNKMATRQLDDTKMLRVYKYSKQTFWDNRWGESPWLLKARGIVLDAGGRIVSHPFDKCFNYLENGTGQNIADDTPIVAVLKLNGFLGICSAHPLKKGELLVHTQGGFGGEFVEYIREYLHQPRTRGMVGRFLSKNDVTLMFEVLHPSDPHIIEYPESMMGLHLLGVRGKNEYDQPWAEEQVDAAALEMGLPRPQWERTTFGKLRSRIKNDRGEGYMVREDTPEQMHLLKWKSPYYLTTKFLGRLSSKRIAHLYGNPTDFKKTVDEEFFVLVDTITQAIDRDSFLAMSNEERVGFVRELIDKLF